MFVDPLPIASLCSVSKSAHYKDEPAIKAFGSKVRQLRMKKGLTLEEFANSVDLHATQLGRIERGETNVTISYITLLAKVLKVSASDLLQDL